MANDKRRSALVTGASQGLGAAIALRLARDGFDVAVTELDQSALGETALRIEATGRRAVPIELDLRSQASIAGAFAVAARAFGALDVLVNNASTFYPTKIGEITPAAWDDLMGTNLKVPVFLSQAAAPALRKSNGLILNIVDIHALRPLRDYPVYCAAKAGLQMITRSLAKELGPEIRVNGISPGPVMWPEGQSDEKARAKIIERTVLKRMGSPEDIARTALFFAAQAPFVTGQILAVDGGRSVAW